MGALSIVVSAFVTLVGAAAIVGGFWYVPSLIQDGIDEAVLLPTSEDDETFAAFKTNDNADAVPVYETYYFYNLLNPAEWLAGTERPNFEEVGPWVYRVYSDKDFIEFLEGGDQVMYRSKSRYVFEPDMSDGNLPTDEVTCITGAWQTVHDNIANGLEDVSSPLPADEMKKYLTTAALLARALAYHQGQGETLSDLAERFILDTGAFTGPVYDQAIPQISLWGPLEATVLFDFGLNNVATTMTLADAIEVVSFLSNVEFMQGFIGLYPVSSALAAALFPSGNIDEPEAGQLFNWVVNQVGDNANAPYFEIFYAVGETPIVGGFDNSAGLIGTRSVHEWLFDFQDPLLAALGIDPQVGIISNDTFVEGNWTIATGQGNLDQAELVLKFRSEEAVDWTVNVPGTDGEMTNSVPLTGANAREATLGSRSIRNQDVPTSQRFNIFSSVVRRAAWFVGNDERTEIAGVRTNRFRLDPDLFKTQDEFTENADYFNDREGFLRLTGVRDGAPLYGSKARFLDSSAEAVAALDGIPAATVEDHDSVVDTEALGGFTLNTALRLQLNFYVTPTSVFYPNINATMMPFYWYETKATARESDTEALVTAQTLALVSSIGFIAGIALAAVGLTMFAISLARKDGGK